jgi:hypothetical protein
LTLPLSASFDWELRVVVSDDEIWPVENKAHVVLRKSDLAGYSDIAGSGGWTTVDAVSGAERSA